MHTTGTRSGSRLFAALSLVLTLCSVQAFCCTTAIVSAEASGTGRPMIWKQRDASNPYNCIAHIKGERYAYTALFPTSDKARRNAYAGINEAGFAISNNLSYNIRPESSGTATRNGEFMSQALGCCRTLDDFVALIDNRPRPMELSSNFAVIDACGGAAYFEVSDSAYVRYDVPEGGYLFRTNFSLSGEEGRGRGFARYASMEEIMSGPKAFRPEFFLEAGRSFVNVLDGGDALRGRRDGYIYQHDFIPRMSTTCSIVIEGVAEGERADSGMMWVAPGFTPCSYAVPVWVAAGDEIAGILIGDAPANLSAVDLSSALRTIDWDARYLEVKPLKRIMKEVRKAEKEELREGRRLDRSLRASGMDVAAVKEYNEAACRRFDGFKTVVKL